jgi:16S rRNA (guanine966-N2)-methyltransferase
MRVIAGTLGGRQFASPGSFKTHPMSDKMRGALFNILGDISGLDVLDAFGGSGALSLEAVSRGAARALVIEQDRPAQRVITDNIAALGQGNKIKLVKAPANAWLQTNQDASFDLVLCDPPYHDLQPSLLQRLTACVKPGGLFVLSYPGGAPEPPAFATIELIKHELYGDAGLYFYRKSL